MDDLDYCQLPVKKSCVINARECEDVVQQRTICVKNNSLQETNEPSFVRFTKKELMSTLHKSNIENRVKMCSCKKVSMAY